MTNAQIAARLADKFLRMLAHRKYVLASDVAAFIDSQLKTIRRWKRKESLHSSLYDYQDYFPNVKWVDSSELKGSYCAALGGRFLVVENPYYVGR